MRHLFVFLIISPLATIATAQEIEPILPRQTIEPPVLAPRLMPQGYYPPVFPAIPPHRPRPDSRDIWQYMGVTQTGRWRPRVIVSPYGAYYYQTGEPYPWPTVHPRAYTPFVLD